MDKEQMAIERIKMASEMSLKHYGKPVVCTYSGGKDSDVLLELFKRSGVLFEVHNSHTTVDAPATVYHIRKKFHELEVTGVKTEIEMPTYKGRRVSMWSLIPQKKLPPTRLARYCCAILKETGCKNRFIATGVRWDESTARADRAAYETIARSKRDKVTASDEVMLMNDNLEKRKLIEQCQLKGKMVVNPIIDWTHRDIWDFIRSEHIEYNELHDCGYKRVGCIGCPMASKSRWKEFADFPTYKRAYISAFQKMLEAIKSSGVETRWESGEDVFLWWMEDENVKGQLSLDDIFSDLFYGEE